MPKCRRPRTCKCCGVYQITNDVTGDRYIGSSRRIHGRIADILVNRGNANLKPDIKKYRKSSFSFVILESIRSSVSNLNLLKAEGKWQTKIKPEYNILAVDPTGHWNVTEEMKKVVSDANTGRPHTEEWKRENSKRMQGNQRAFGLVHTPETKAIISATHKGKPKSLETRRKMSIAQRERFACQ